MKKRFPKTRKRIKNTSASAKSKRSLWQKSKTKKPECNRGGALVPYERGEIESVGASADEEVMADPSQETENVIETTPRSEIGRRADILRLVCGFVVVFSLFCAVVLTCFAFAVATEYAQNSTDEDAFAELENNGGEGEKTIFIHTDGKGDGLTAPEIYERCAKTAVSVWTSFPDGGEGIGSGFIFTEDGYIATASHVICDAQRVDVILSDGKEYEATVIAADQLSDVALLKINVERKLPVAELGDSESLLAGERVYAIGTPAHISYAGSLTSGEVSCAQRIIPVYREGVTLLEKRIKVIQINAEVNKGNSGCPLFDSYGKVIGMVTMRLGEDFRGIGFALPVDGIEPILRSMLEGRALDREVISGVVELPARLGVNGYTDQEGGVYGCRIDSLNDSAASLGALKAGDLIVQIDNKIITAASDISSVIEQKNAGERVKVTLIRSGQRLTFDIVLGN